MPRHRKSNKAHRLIFTAEAFQCDLQLLPSVTVITAVQTSLQGDAGTLSDGSIPAVSQPLSLAAVFDSFVWFSHRYSSPL